MQQIKAWMAFLGRHPAVALGLVLLCYGMLLLPAVNRQGISWDEQTDIDIARSYLVRPGGWLRGSPSDPSQTRLPMAVVAVVYALTNTDDLLTARMVSCLVGALTIVGVFVACRRDLDARKGLLAGIILATSPFFLSFARTAFTETDIFVACALAWLLAAVSRLRESGTLGWAAVTGVVLGLALSGKATTIVITPAILIHLLTFPRERQGEPLASRDIRSGALLVAAMGAAIGFGWFSLHDLPPQWREDVLLQFHFLLAFGGWAAVLIWALRHRDKVVTPLCLGVFVLALALGTFMVVPPVHTTNPAIIASLISRFEHEMGWTPAFMGEAAILHIASVIVKSSPLVGVGLLASLGTAGIQWRTRPELRFPLLTVAFYSLGLVLLPLAQTFYMIPVLPILAILGADQLLALASRRRWLALCIGALVAVGLAVDLVLCYPDFNLNGYQWIGARFIGNRSSVGYRSIVQTPSDGVEQAARWLNEHARPGDRVVAYVYPWHILEATSPDPPFRYVRGQWNSVRTRPDYVVVHINATIRQRWAAYFSGEANNARAESIWWEPYDAEWLEAHFTKVMSVRRAFGIEMASIWERNDQLGRE
jgi:4-amino-4-deoxy-L-arabinose transferase-like glycosyltransferase